MAILITGRTNLLKGIPIEDYLPGESIVICTRGESFFRFVRHNVMTTELSPSDRDWDRLFEVHDFTGILYLSDLIDPLADDCMEAGNLFRILTLASQHKVANVFLCIPDLAAERDETPRRQSLVEMQKILGLFEGREQPILRTLTIPYLLNAKTRTTSSWLFGRTGPRSLTCHGKRGPSKSSRILSRSSASCVPFTPMISRTRPPMS